MVKINAASSVPASRYFGNDWKQPSGYLDNPLHPYRLLHPELNEIPIHIWRWEFLRRAPEYNRAYDSYEYESEPLDAALASPQAVWLAALAEQKRRTKCRTDREYNSSVNLAEQIGIEFGLLHVVDPRMSSTDVWDTWFWEYDAAIGEPDIATSSNVFARLGRLNFDMQDSTSITRRSKHRRKTLFAIDLGMPLEPQLDLIQKRNAAAKKNKRPATRGFELELRLLDAAASYENEEVDWRHISEIFSREAGRQALTPEYLRRKYNRAKARISEALRPFHYTLDAWADVLDEIHARYVPGSDDFEDFLQAKLEAHKLLMGRR